MFGESFIGILFRFANVYLAVRVIMDSINDVHVLFSKHVLKMNQLRTTTYPVSAFENVTVMLFASTKDTSIGRIGFTPPTVFTKKSQLAW